MLTWAVSALCILRPAGPWPGCRRLFDPRPLLTSLPGQSSGACSLLMSLPERGRWGGFQALAPTLSWDFTPTVALAVSEIWIRALPLPCLTMWPQTACPPPWKLSAPL